ncbi:hypothetical protein [Acetobacter okinawensis]|uniref:hypothetical protein n=1 Tax=Acetobacter okinawensis TaxID=1076594 RepID=UPI0011DDEABC|nr:hypothetical protein [Acetobacter okinawensis]
MGISKDYNPRQPSKALSEADATHIIQRISAGEFLNRIAADYDVNPGRISEVKTGKLFPSLHRPSVWPKRKK